MIVVQGSVQIHSEDVAVFREASAAMLAATRAEDGCIAYHFAEDFSEPGLVHFVERWRDDAAMKAHGKSAHMAAFGGAIRKLRMSGMRVVGYAGGEERVLIG
ncbi:MAG: putative quinol monooxygenase [Hyphomonadaceae bacterium]